MQKVASGQTGRAQGHVHIEFTGTLSAVIRAVALAGFRICPHEVLWRFGHRRTGPHWPTQTTLLRRAEEGKALKHAGEIMCQIQRLWCFDCCTFVHSLCAFDLQPLIRRTVIRFLSSRMLGNATIVICDYLSFRSLRFDWNQDVGGIRNALQRLRCTREWFNSVPSSR